MNKIGYRYLGLFLSLNIAFQLVSDATAGKLVTLAGYGVPVSILYFPVTYLLGDIITEVYGYAQARTVLWYTLFASVLAGLLYQFAIYVPPAPFFKNNEAYAIVFGAVPRMLVAGWLATFAGETSNNFILAKMKVLTQGKYLWTRTIGSTIVGQAVGTTVFFLVGFTGSIPADRFLKGLCAAWIIKTTIETIMTPVTYLVVGFLKRKEGVDYFDVGTNFSPFIIGAIQLEQSLEQK
ncbi:MAG: queuosine precursor transporter [Alphaproteobacteria bacterium]|nr:queuosine precursor transporter [Alphaproteobacteria bacterium]